MEKPMEKFEYRKEVYQLFKKLERTLYYYLDEENNFLDDYFEMMTNLICDGEYELLYEIIVLI